MNRMFLAVLVLSISISSIAAQTKQKPAGTTRVAVVNVGIVFNEYEKATWFKKEIEATLTPFKEKGKVLTEQMKAWQAELQSPDTDPATRSQLAAAMNDNRMQLQKMQTEVQQAVGKKQEANLVALWQDVQECIQTYAKEHEIQLVLSYGDPVQKESLNQFHNINRKMQSMDAGSSVPIFVGAGVDISQEIVEILNRNYQQRSKTKAEKADNDDMD